MKIRYIFSFVATALLFTNCMQEEIDVPMNVMTVEATMEGELTKSTVGENGTFLWAEGDNIAIHTANSTLFGKYASGAGTSSATFTYGSTESAPTLTGATYPYNVAHCFDGTYLTFEMPALYELGNNVSNTNAPMLAILPEVQGMNTQAPKFNFSHLGGVFCFTYVNVPAGANKFTLSLGNKKINGTFTATVGEGPVTIATEDTENAGLTTLTFTPTTAGQTITLYVPVPTGTYESIEAKLYAGNEVLDVKSGAAQNTVNRRTLVRMPAVTFKEVSGDIDNSVKTEAELHDAIAAGGTVTLADNITLTKPLKIGAIAPQVRSGETNAEVILDLNGKTLTTSEAIGDGWSAAVYVEGGNVTIKNGTIASSGEAAHAKMGAVWVKGSAEANVTIESGVFKGNCWNVTPSTAYTDDLMATVYVSNANGKVTINGGEFYAVKQAQVAGQNQILNYSNSLEEGTIEVKGGKFHGMNPAIGNGVEVSYLADGYSSVETTEGVFEVKKGIHTEAALKAAIAAGKTEVTLDADIDLISSVEVCSDLTVNLNGKSIKCALSDVFVVSGGTLTIDGEGLVYGSEGNQGNSCAVWVNGANAKAIIKNGTYKVGGDIYGESDQRNDCIYVGKAGGTIDIYGGVFEYTGDVKDGSLNDGSRFLVNQNNNNTTQLITIYGGTFHNFDPANAKTDEPWMTDGVGSFVAPGYSSVVAENNTYVVQSGIFNEAALKVAVANGGAVTLTEDITLTSVLKIEKDVTVNLNSFNLTADNTVFYTTGGTLTVEGDGTVTAAQNTNQVAVWAAAGSNVVINGGTFSVGVDDTGLTNSCIYSTGGTITINGGSFSNASGTPGGGGIFNVKNDSNGKIVINNVDHVTVGSGSVIYEKEDVDKNLIEDKRNNN